MLASFSELCRISRDMIGSTDLVSARFSLCTPRLLFVSDLPLFCACVSTPAFGGWSSKRFRGDSCERMGNWVSWFSRSVRFAGHKKCVCVSL